MAQKQMTSTNNKVANIIFNKKLDYKSFYACFVIQSWNYDFYEEHAKEFGDVLTAEEFYTLVKVGKRAEGKK